VDPSDKSVDVEDLQAGTQDERFRKAWNVVHDHLEQVYREILAVQSQAAGLGMDNPGHGELARRARKMQDIYLTNLDDWQGARTDYANAASDEEREEVIEKVLGIAFLQ
jgi:hypothetical protein